VVVKILYYDFYDFVGKWTCRLGGSAGSVVEYVIIRRYSFIYRVYRIIILYNLVTIPYYYSLTSSILNRIY